MSILARLWQLIRRPTGYVGKDLEGNLFYEYPGEWRTKRVVRYQGRKDMLDLATGQHQLAVQWKSWLSHTRTHPPTLEELQADVMRRIKLQRNVALIEERDRQERERLALRNASPSVSNALRAPNSELKEAAVANNQADAKAAPSHERRDEDLAVHTKPRPSSCASHQTAERAPPVPPPEALATQSWTPVAARRRG